MKTFAGDSQGLGKYFSAISSTLCYLMLDLQGKILDVNEKFCEICEYSSDELLGKNLFDLRPEIQSDGGYISISNIIEVQKEWRGQVRVTSKSRAIFWLDLSVVKIFGDEGDVFFAFGFPITDVKRIEQVNEEISNRLVQSEIRYRALLENQTDLVVILTPEGTRKFVNSAFAKFFGKPRRHFVGTSIAKDNLFGLDKDYAMSISNITQQSPTFSKVHSTIDVRENPQWILWQATGVFNGKGEILEIISVGRNITQLVEADLHKTQYLQALEEIAFKTSHKIRGPLTTMQGLINLINKNAITTEELITMTDLLKNSLDAVDKATHDLTIFINEHYSGVKDNKFGSQT